MLSGERRGSRHRRTSGRWSLLGLGVTGAGLIAVAVAVAVGIGQVAGSAPACAAALSAANAAAAARAAGAVSGIATHYVLQGGGGNCSYAGPPSDGLYVALSPSEYAAAGACGGYIEVSGPDGSVRVKVIDQCPECKAGHLDLSEAAFAKLAPLKAGLINVSYGYLANPPLPGPISVIVKPGSSRYWLSLVIDNTGNPLASVQVSTSSGGWESLSRASYDAWNSASGPGPGPYTVKLTDTQGHQVEVRGITLSPGSQETTATWMYGAGAGPGTVAPPPPTPVAPPSSPAPTTAAPSRPASASHHPVPSASAARTRVPGARPSARPRRAPSAAASAAAAAVAGTATPHC